MCLLLTINTLAMETKQVSICDGNLIAKNNLSSLYDFRVGVKLDLILPEMKIPTYK